MDPITSDCPESLVFNRHNVATIHLLTLYCSGRLVLELQSLFFKTRSIEHSFGYQHLTALGKFYRSADGQEMHPNVNQPRGKAARVRVCM